MASTTDNWVNTTGDTMTGPLLVNFNTATASVQINNSSGGNALYINATGNTVATSSLYVYTDNTNGGSYAILGSHAGNGSGIYGTAAGTGYGIYGSSSNGGAGVAGYFVNNNAANTGIAVTALNISNSTGEAGYFAITDAANTAAALSGITSGTSITSYGVYGSADGSGKGVIGVNNSTGYAIYGRNDGSGPAGMFLNNNVGSTAPPLLASTTGTGNLMNLQKNGSTLFFVDNAGTAWASGTAVTTSGYMNFGATAGTTGYGLRDNAGSIEYKDGSGSWIAFSSLGGAGSVAKTGDTMSGALGITNSGATASLYVYQTGTTNEAAHFEVANVGSTNAAVTAKTNGSGQLFYGNTTGTGNLLQLQNGGTDTTVVDNNGTLTLSRISGNAVLNLKATVGNNMSAITFLSPGAASLWTIHNDIFAVGGQTFSIKDEIAVAERLMIDSTGRIGIGTASPLWQLDVNGTVSATGTIIPTNGYMNFGSTSGTSGYGFRDNGGTLEYKNDSGSWAAFTSGGGSYVAKTGDTMTGGLIVSFDTATNSVEITNTTSGKALYANNTSAGAGFGIFGGQSGAGYGIYGSNSSSGTGVRAYNSSSGYGLYSEAADTGIAAYITNSFSSNTNAPLIVNTQGTGRLFEARLNSSVLFDVDNSGVAWASGTVVQASGYMNFGTTSGTAGYGIRDNGGAIQFKNDGGSWVNVPNGTGYVLKSGDEMTGALGLTNSGATATIYAYQTGTTNQAAYFGVDNSSSTSDAVYITSNSNSLGLGLFVYHSGSNGGAARIESTAGMNAQDVLYLKSNSNTGGNTLDAVHSGSSGVAGIFQSTNMANATNTLYVTTNSTDGGLNGRGLSVLHIGTGGNAARIINNNTNVATDTVYVRTGSNTNGANGIHVVHTGTGTSNGILVDNDNTGGYAGEFINSNNVTNYAALHAHTSGLGNAAYFSTMLGANSAPTVYITSNSTMMDSGLLGGNHTGAGSIMDFAVSGSRVFYVGNNAVMYATGAVVMPNGYMNFGGEYGSGGYGVRDNAGTLEYKNSGGSWASFSTGSFVAKTGDTMSGPLFINYNTATATLHVNNNSPGNVAYFSQSGINSATAAVYMNSENSDPSGYTLKVSQTGLAAAALFSNDYNALATSAVTISSGSGMPGNRTLHVINKGTEGTALLVNGSSSIETTLSVRGNGMAVNNATASVYMENYNQNQASYLLHARTYGEGASAFFENANQNTSTATVVISSDGDWNDNASLRIVHFGNRGKAIDATAKTSINTPFRFIGQGIGVSNATASVYMLGANQHEGSSVLHVENKGMGSAAVFENTETGSNASATVRIATYYNNFTDTNNVGLQIDVNGSNGKGLLVDTTTSNGPLASFMSNGTNNYATDVVRIVDYRTSPLAAGIHSTAMRTGSAAVFESANSVSATATVRIVTGSINYGRGLLVEHSGQYGNALDVRSSTSESTLATFSYAPGSAVATAAIYIENTNSSSGSKGLHVLNKGNGGAAAMFETSGNNPATATVLIRNRANQLESTAFRVEQYGMQAATALFQSYYTSNATPTIMVENEGFGDFMVFRKAATPKFYVDINGNVYASGTINGLGTSGSYVNKTGDAMTGPLYVGFDTATETVTIVNHGAGTALSIDTTGNTTAARALSLTTDNTNGGSYGIYSETTGFGSPGYFYVNNAANNKDAVAGYSQGVGNSVAGYATAGGRAGYFENAYSSSSYPAVAITTNSDVGNAYGLSVTNTGTGSDAAHFYISNASNNYSALSAMTNGGGNAGSFEISNVANISPALTVTTSGTGNGANFSVSNNTSSASSVFATTVGSGNASYFTITNSGNANAAVHADTDGTGAAVYGLNTGTGSAGNFQISNNVNTNPALMATTSGTGNAVYATTSGSGTVGYFENTTNTNASPAIDVVTNTSIATGYGIRSITSGMSSAGYFKTTSGTNANPALTAETAGSGAALLGYTTGSGIGVIGQTIGTSYAGYFSITNNSSEASTLLATTNGVGAAIKSLTTGTGFAGNFVVSNTSSATDSVYILTDSNTAGGHGLRVTHKGTGDAAALIEINNVSNSNAIIFGNTTGTGNLLQLQKGASNKFIVDNNGGVSHGCSAGWIDGGGFCINSTFVGASLLGAASDCASQEATVCSAGMFVHACANGLVTPSTGTNFLVDSVTATGVSVISTTATPCTDASLSSTSIAFNTTAFYYCCRVK